MKRNKHTLSHYRMLTGNMGQILPISCMEVLPGDTFQHSTEALIRLSPLNTPVMHPVTVRVHHFFVPNRVVMPDWEDFITGADDTVSIPTMDCPTTKDDIRHLLGLPPTDGAQVSEIPVRAFNKIFNDYYKDQDLVTERLEDDTTIPLCAWEKDYFGTARPWTQKGGEVTIPLGDTAPVIGDPSTTLDPTFDSDDTINSTLFANISGAVGITNSPANPDGLYWNDPKLVADLSGATGADINDVRKAFAIQRYQEARARYGSRYTEYLRYLGVRPSDARLQRAELLGGGTTQLNFSEVLQTTPTDTPDTNGVGDLYGHGIGGMRGNKYRKFFDEHGYVISVMSVRPKAIYMDGVHRHWLRTTKEDFWQKELEHIGQQEIKQDEIFNAPGQENDIFGYQDRYRCYREHPSMILGDFRDTLNQWHLGRSLTDSVTLNESFIECDPSKRIFQVTNEQPLWIMVNNHVVARRLVSRNASARVM